jgi:HEAT repeat protein
VEMAEDKVELDFHNVFCALLDDDDQDVQLIAIEGLWEDERRSTAELLLRLVQSDADPRVRGASASALGRWMLQLELGDIDAKWGDNLAASLLALAVDQTQPIEVRRRAVEAVGYLSTPEIRSIIQDAYDDTDEKMRASALFAMGRNSDTRWYDILLAEVTNDNPEMRFEAVRAIGELEDPRAASALVAATTDDDEEVRLAAVASLGKVGGQTARQALQQIKVQDDVGLRLAAEEALDELLTSEDPLGVRPGEIGKN